MTTRRKLFIGLGAGALVAPLSCFAQQRSKVARIGLLEVASASIDANLRAALIAGLRDRGYVRGRNLVVEYRWADGKHERFPGLAAELVQMKVDVIVAPSEAVQAAQQATTTIPIVMVGTTDPVGKGFVASLARPGRNITGLSNVDVDVVSKHLELLRAVVPKLSRVAVLLNLGSPNHANNLKRIKETGRTSNVTISPVPAGAASQIEAAFGLMKQDRAGALIVLPDPIFRSQARQIAELAQQQRLPTMFWNRELVASGGLMSYGQNSADHYYRAATYIEKILKGAKPGELPVEQTTKIELAINLRTAKAIGLTIPRELLVRADKVIE